MSTKSFLFLCQTSNAPPCQKTVFPTMSNKKHSFILRTSNLLIQVKKQCFTQCQTIIGPLHAKQAMLHFMTSKQCSILCQIISVSLLVKQSLLLFMSNKQCTTSCQTSSAPLHVKISKASLHIKQAVRLERFINCFAE